MIPLLYEIARKREMKETEYISGCLTAGGGRKQGVIVNRYEVFFMVMKILQELEYDEDCITL